MKFRKKIVDANFQTTNVHGNEILTGVSVYEKSEYFIIGYRLMISMTKDGDTKRFLYIASSNVINQYTELTENEKAINTYCQTAEVNEIPLCTISEPTFNINSENYSISDLRSGKTNLKATLLTTFDNYQILGGGALIAVKEM